MIPLIWKYGNRPEIRQVINILPSVCIIYMISIPCYHSCDCIPVNCLNNWSKTSLISGWFSFPMLKLHSLLCFSLTSICVGQSCNQIGDLILYCIVLIQLPSINKVMQGKAWMPILVEKMLLAQLTRQVVKPWYYQKFRLDMPKCLRNCSFLWCHILWNHDVLSWLKLSICNESPNVQVNEELPPSQWWATFCILCVLQC